MRYYKCIFLIVFFSSMSLFSQEKIRQHTVSKGETISEIAQKYNVKPSAIYELNPDAVNGIKYKTVLLIPTKTKQNKTVSPLTLASNLAEKTHEVLPKETVYGIAKLCNISVEELYKLNPDLEKVGLKIGQKINIPQTAPDDFVVTPTIEKSEETIKTTATKAVLPEIKNPKTEVVVAVKSVEKVQVSVEGISYEVLPKESLYSIAKKYGITLANLQKANPELGKKSLKVGQKITVPVNADANTTLVAEKSKNLDNPQKEETKQTPVLQQSVVENKKMEVEKTIPVLSKAKDDSKKSTTDITHEVLPKESLYSIAKQYGISLSELIKANSELGSQSLKVGQKITVPVKSDANTSLVAEKVTDKKEAKTGKELAITQQVDIEFKTSETEMTHEVLPKETKYGIAKQYGLTVAELESQNPNISKKLLVGSVLKIRTSKLIEKETAVENPIASEAPNNQDKIENKEPNIVRDATFVDQLISKASENIGTRYRSGGTTTDGFDCSGLMCYTFSSYDIKLPRSSIEMASYGSKIDAQNAQKGDLIFFKTRGSGRINHVGMVVEVLEGEIKFIHSATHGGVIISSTKESYYERNLVQVNRVL
jgi:cell wall-associated NlpC family hydrolase